MKRTDILTDESLDRLNPVERALEVMKRACDTVVGASKDQATSNGQIRKAFQEQVYLEIRKLPESTGAADGLKDLFESWFGSAGDDNGPVSGRVNDIRAVAINQLGTVRIGELRGLMSGATTDDRLYRQGEVVNSTDESINKTTSVVDDNLEYSGRTPVHNRILIEFQSKMDEMEEMLASLDGEDKSYPAMKAAFEKWREFVNVEFSRGWYDDWDQRWRGVQKKLEELRSDKVFTMELN